MLLRFGGHTEAIHESFHTDWDDHLDHLAECAIMMLGMGASDPVLNYGQHVLSLQTYSHVPAAAEFVVRVQQGTERTKSCIECTQQKQKAYADLGHRDVTLIT